VLGCYERDRGGERCHGRMAAAGERERRDGRNEMEELGFLHFYYEPSASQPSVLI
jgi:hypothetical protein